MKRFKFDRYTAGVAAMLALVLGVAAAVALAAGPTTGTNTACATATIGVNGNPVYTATGCNTVTYTIPTVTTTVTGSTSSTSTTSTTATTPPPPGIGACAVNPPGSTWAVGGQSYNQAGVDTFTKDAAVGSFAATTDQTPVYTGDHGMAWIDYADGWGANGVTPAYSPSTVQSASTTASSTSTCTTISARARRRFPAATAIRRTAPGRFARRSRRTPARTCTTSSRRFCCGRKRTRTGPRPSRTFRRATSARHRTRAQFSAFAHFGSSRKTHSRSRRPSRTSIRRNGTCTRRRGGRGSAPTTSTGR